MFVPNSSFNHECVLCYSPYSSSNLIQFPCCSQGNFFCVACLTLLDEAICCSKCGVMFNPFHFKQMIQKFKNSQKFFHQENRENDRNYYKSANFSHKNFFENNLSYINDNYNNRYSETCNFHTPTNFNTEIKKTAGGYFVPRKIFFLSK
jgi:hypothetical protein